VFGLLEHPLLSAIPWIFYEKIGYIMIKQYRCRIVFLAQIKYHLVEEFLTTVKLEHSA
jgi:hypothetical protein